MNTLATVVNLIGRAWAVAADGTRRELNIGDRLRGDEMLVTEPGARVDLDFGNNQQLTFLGEQQQGIAEAAQSVPDQLPTSSPRTTADERTQPQSQAAQGSGEPEGHNFVQLVRINEIIEADGITPLTIARIQEVLRPLGMSLPERVYDLDEWREHRGGDERYEDAPAARHPGLTVELQGAGPDGIYSEAEIGTDGTVPAEVTLDDKVRVGDRLVIKDGKGNTLLDRPVTQDDLDNGVTVEVPVVPGDRNVTVEATVTTPRGYTGRDRDDKPVDNLPPDEVTILPPQDSEDAESISLDLGSYFEDNVDGKDLTYDVTGLPPGLSFDPDTGIITGTIDRSASQGGPDDDGIYKVTVTITDKVGNQTTIDFDWTVTNPEPEARDDRQTIDEDTVATGNVLTGAGNDPGVDGSDSDPDGDDLTVTSFTIGNDPTVYPADGTPVSVEDADGNLIGEITLNENGDYSFTPVPDWNGSVPDIHYTISDGEGGEDEARLSITVAPVNDPVELENIPDPNDPNDPGYPAVNDPTDPNDPARGNANDHVVFESALPGGSDQSPNQADLKVESSFTINAPDGLHGSQGLVLTYTNINGESRTLNLGKKQIEQLGSNNQTVDTQYGKLVLNGHTLNADGTISIDYEYTLERAPEVGGDHVDDRINIAVRDSDAHHPSDTDSKDLVIRIIDDAPVARNDANGIDEDTAVPVTGNVIANGSTGDVADTLGADGATVTGVTAGDQTAGGHVADGGVAGNIIGDYGTLVLNADGSYSYELDNSNLAVQGLHPDDAPLTDVFTYTITDADGDQSTATLTITVNGSNDGVTVTVPDPNDPADPNYPTVNDPTDPNDPARGNVNDHVVFESGLAGGSATNSDDTRVVSSFTLSALDGLNDTAAITIEVAGNSLTLNKAEVEDLANSSQSISTEYGELVLNGYTPNADGSISIDYQYTLTSAPDNTGGNGVHTDDIISITVNDRDTDSDSQDLVIRIIDDAPVARDDANEIAEDDAAVTGNVITGGSTDDVADTEGADGATVTAIVSDNDATSTATTNADGDLVIEGEFGTLTISPDGSYTYALNNDNAEVNALKTGETLVDEFSYTLTDIDGDSDTATLTITINGNTDGAPTIVPEDVNGPDVPTDITSQEHVTVHERGLTGADSSHITDGSVTITAPDGLQSITVGGVPVDLAQLAALDPNDPATHIEIDTPQGKLTLTGFDVTDSVGGVPTEGELQFTYELEEVQNTPADPADPDVGRNSTETIPLIVTDAGGGTGTGDLVINIIDDVPVAVDDTNAITEDELSVTGNVIGGPSAAAGDEADTLGADGATVTEVSNAATGSNMTTLPNGDLVIEGQYGTLTIRPDGFYTYELNNDHPDVNALKDGDDLQEVFTYTLTDGDGDSDTADLTITINGRTDGEPSIVPEDDNGNGAIDGHNTVNESGLAGGSTAGDGSNIVDGTIQISAGDGLASITIGGQTFELADLQALSASTPSAAIPVEGGTLVLTGFTPGTSVGGVPTSGILEYTYTLTGERTHSGSEDQSLLLDIPLSVTDAGNGTANGTLTIQVVDDAPQASDDTNSITEDDLSVVGNVIDGDAAGDGADIEGADSATITDISSTSGNSADDSDPSGVLVIEGEYGTLTIQPNGEYEYVLNNDNAEVNKLKDGETLTEEFTYTLTDTDGDSDTARLTITINGRTDASPSIVPEDDNGNGAIDGHNTVNESGLRDPADVDTSNIVDGSIQISAGDGLASISIGGQTFSLADLQALSASTPSAAIPVEGGTLVLTGFTPGTSVGGVPTSGTLEYTYTLTGERAHSGSEDQSLLLDIPLSVTDAGNETANGTLTIQVMDDVPTAVADIGNVTEGATLIVDAANGVLTNDTAGADGWHALGAVVGVVAGDTGTTSSGGVGGRIDGQYGYLILNADGSYEYVSTADAVTGDEVDVFTYTVRDGDGDLSHTTLTINVADVTLTPVTTPDSVNESGLVGGSTEGDNSHITSGQVNLPPELEVIPDSGTTTYGTFTIDEDGNYTYTLTGTTSGDATTDSFTYVTTDANGNTVTNTVTIDIVDDEPVAVDDANSITEDEVSVTGNVIGGPSASTDDAADTKGADGATVTEISSAYGSMIAQPNGDLVIEGQYGKLTIRPDGFYTYELNNDHPDVNALKDGVDLQDVFTYTLTDGDGDSGTADLTITINGRTDGAPDLNITDHNSLDVGHNSIAEDATAPVTGEFTVTAPDGLEEITIGGITVTEAELADLTGNPVTIPGTEGTLTLTGYDPDTGKVTYEYQQTGNNKDHSGGDNSVTDHFPITVTDKGGDTSAPSDLVILITDTAPVANPDTGSIDEDGAALIGNVITDAGSGEDEIGADLTTVTGVTSNNDPAETATDIGGGVLEINGEYGTLTIQPDGSYTYELHDSAKVNALKDGDVRQEVFEYTITDSDGDSDNTTLTITINGKTDGSPSIMPEDDNGNGAIDGHNTVNESGLAGGSSAGDGSNSVDGTIQLSAGDGLASITIGGQSFTLAELQALSAGSPSAAIPVEGGTLVLTGFNGSDLVGGVPTSGTLQYTYTLTGERTHSGAGNDDVLLDIPLSVTDAGNETVNGTLTIQVVDDVPEADTDTGNVTEGGTLTVDAANGVLNNDDSGADGWASTGAVVGVVAGDTNATSSGGVGGRIDGQYGYLILNADGSYEYVSTADAVTGDEVDVFTYTVRDGDGDLAHTTLTINVADVTLAPETTVDSVNESGLSGGTTEGDNSHTTSGQVNLPPGLEVVPGSGTTTHGTFTIDQDGNYSYTLTGNTSGDNTSDSFTYVTRDANGNTVENTVTINIVDDRPVAVDDVNSIPAGSYVEVTGELINGGLGGAGQDSVGADGATVTSVVNTPVGEPAGTPVTVPTDGTSTTITGQYGVLTIEADGSYSYQRNPGTPGGVEDVFTYTITDGDGDTDEATLTIDIGNATPSIRDLTPSVSGGELVFEEKHLADGSAPDSAQLTKSGDFTISSPDGIGSLVVGTVTVIENGVLTSTTTVITPQGHTLEITGYDPVTGRVTYEYTLTGREDHDQSTNDTELFDEIPVVLTDRDGEVANDTLSVRIIDDVPQAAPDTGSIAEDTVDPLEGNVRTNDERGADGATVTEVANEAGTSVAVPTDGSATTINGQYGVLTIEADGSYSYELDNDNAEVNALKDGETLTEEFTYTLTDGDGDSDNTTLTITINGRTDGSPSIVPNDDNGNGAIDGHNTVNESGLAGGSSAGDGSNIVDGSIQLSAGDGLGSISIGGQSFTLAELQALSAGSPSAAIAVEGGTLVLTGFTPGTSVGGVPTSGTLQYTYTLTGERTHSSAGNDDVLLNIPLSVTDAGNETVYGTLTVQVVDDVPTAADDTADVAAGEFELEQNGNVLTNDTEGADGARVTSVTPDNGTETAVPGTGNLVIDGDYGRLTIHSDGSYSYQRNPGTPGGVEDVFTYTITDGDGDVASAELTIRIADSAPTVTIPAAGSGSTTVYESGLPDGSDNIPDRATTSGSIEFNSADGLGTVSLGGHTLTEIDQTFPTTGPAGSLTARYEYDPVTGKGSIHYSYTLKETTSGDNTLASFPVEITDQDGDAAPSGNLVINIVDDTPTAAPDQATVTEGATLTVDAANGVLENDAAGADGWHDSGNAVVDVASNNQPSNTASLVGGALVIEGEYGTLTLNADGSYTYESRANAVTGDEQDVFTYTVSDADGDETTATLTINISDVTGISRDTTGTVDEAGLPAGSDSSSDKETTGGSLNLADGWTVDPSSVGNQSSGTGTLTINADGSYSYTLNSRTEDVDGVDEVDTFTYTAIDQYGNTVTNTVTITIIDDVPSVTLTGNALGEVQVDETTLGDSASADFSGAFSHDFGADGDGGLVYTLEVDTAATGLLDTETGDPIVLVASPDGLTVTGHVGDDSGPAAFTISVDANGEVTLTQNRPLQHSDPNNHDDVLALPAGSLKLTGTVTDGDGDTDSASVDIGGRFSFRDDGPTIGAAPAPGVVDEAYLTTGSGDGTAGLSTETSADLDVDFGADGQGSLVFSDDQVALRNWLDASGNTDITITGTGTSVLSGTRGGQEIFTVTLTVDASGQASYHFELKGALLHRSPTQDHELTFSYAAVDGDGDRANGTFRVDVKDDEPRSKITIDVDEDDANGPFSTSADATQDNTTISATDGGSPITGTDGPNGKDYDVGHGTVTVHEDGRITYAPNPDYSNHGSPDEFYVTVTEDDGTSQTIEVTVNVIPVADAPELTVDSNSVTTNEDEAIGLGLNAPKTNDDTDQNGSDTAGDNPERLGPITLSGFPAGAQLLDGTDSDSPLHTFDGTGSVTIVISANVDDPHFNGAIGTLTLTTAQYEALKVLPPAESSANFTVDVSVTSYEVDESGNPLTEDVNGDPIDGAESTVSVTVNVQAVTDGIDLTIHDGDDNYVDADSTANAVTLPAFDEDGSINLKDYLQITLDETGDGNSGADTDGSEQRWFEVSGVPVGWTVDGVLITTPGQSVLVTIPNDYNGASPSLPDIVIQPPADFSGDLDGVRVTLYAQDRDSDGPNPLGARISDSVYLNLRINPQGGDVAADDVTTEEDTAVAFLKHVRVTDTGTGSEVITEVRFSLPDDWELVDEPAGKDTDWEMTGSGTPADPYIITSLNGTDLEGVLDGFLIQPPAHSSRDEDIVVRVTSTDTNTVDGNSVAHSDWRDLTIEVEVTPKGERVEDIGNPDRDTDGNNNPDLTMTSGRDYTTPGEEDEWFMLGQEAGFNLKDGWSNEDGRGVENGGTAGSGSEETFALLTPNLIAGDGSQADATGSEFQWGPVVGPDGARQFSEVFGGDPIEVPIEYLNTLEFKAAPHFSGMFEIKVQAKTVDYDEDYPGDESRADVQVSGDAILTNILIAPKADTVTATVTARVEGDEDERMPLSIRPKSSDPSESFEVDIDDIPDGATLWYDGVELTSDADTSAWPNISITDNGDGTWKVEFTDFDPSKGAAMEIRAPQDSNEPFDLDIAIRSVDELHIPNPGGTPDPIIHRDVSSDYPLTITVAPKGIADEALIDLIDYDDPITGVDPFTEADVDAAGGVMLSDLIVNAQLKDNDDSETLTFKISGLPDGFSIEGATFMGGSGTDREWSLTEAQLAGARLVTPPNFNGSQTFDFYSVTTEDDNDSLTEQHSVELRVSPSPEATINLEASIDEDVSTRLDFSIQHRNGDVDEVLEEVWISAADLAALGDLNLTYGQNGPSLADAADAGNTSVVLDNGWYKLTGAAIDNVYAQGRENWHGDASFGVHYVIRDPALDSSVSDVSEGFDGIYEVTVNPITDQVTLVDPADISLSSPGNTGITLNIGNTGADYDGSEQLTRIILEHVPEGVVVVGTADYDVDFVGDGTWVLIPSGGSFNGLLTTSIALQVHGRAGGLDDHQIRVTVVTEDAGNGAESRASTEVGLTTNFAEGDPEAPATIERWEQTSFEPTEDVAFNLGQAIDAEIDATGVTNSGFTITLTDLPPGTQVTGMTRTMVNGQEVWSVSGQGGAAELQSLLSSITVTPPLDWNSNKGPFEYNATLTTHTPTGGRAQAELAVKQTVIPVTDHAAISIDMPAVDEGNDLAISINISNPSDDPEWELVDGNLYLELDESGMSAGGGMLLDASGNPLIQAPDGRYVIENVTPGTPINLTYVPSGPYVSGSISLEASVTGQENGAASSLETTVSQQGDVNPINNGYDFDVNTSSGDEAPVAADKEHAIRLNITDNGLVDDDGSESITAILLKNLPNDFLVFVGEDAASATLAEMANNAGGSGTNTWVLEPGADGNLPPYIAILPPKNWSGTLEDLELTVISGEGSRSDSATDTRTFNLEVNPVANGLAINPTPSFGREGEIIGLNLNARFEDLRQAGTTDESVERATVELKGLGEHAAIYVGGNLIMDRVTYDEVNDVYTITGLTQDEIDQLGFVQAAGDINNLQVRARTEEYDASTGAPVAGVEPSDWTHGTDDGWDGAAVTTNISTQFGTSGADELLWTGQGVLNGRGGEDTVQLRFGESLEGSDLAAHLRNIEVIDLGIPGSNQIGGLRVEDVLAMTDDRDTLKIFGDAEDAVSLDDPSAWTHAGQATEEGKTFNVYEGGGATLWVEQGVQGVIID